MGNIQLSCDVNDITAAGRTESISFFLIDLSGDSLLEAVNRAAVYCPELAAEINNYDNIDEFISDDDNPYEIYAYKDKDVLSLRFSLLKRGIDTPIPLTEQESNDFVYKIEAYKQEDLQNLLAMCKRMYDIERE